MKSPDICIFDLETFDTIETSVVISMSIYCGDYISGTPKEMFDHVVDNCKTFRFSPKAQIDAGRTTSQGTLDFWKGHPEALKMVQSIGEKIDFRDVYDKVKDYLDSVGYSANKTTVWIRAPHFDHPILENLILCGTGVRKVPYQHWRVRDVRTAVDIAIDSTKGYPDNIEDIKAELGVVKHNPEHDIALDVALLKMFTRLD